MPPGWKVTPPKNDSEYFERLSRTIFTAGLSWEMVENKWPNFKKTFVAFSPEAVARMTEKDVRSLMGDPGIVRNERKIRATIHNAGEVVALKKEFGSVKGYVASFGKDEGRLQDDLQERFQHVGGSTRVCFYGRWGTSSLPPPKRKSGSRRTPSWLIG